jgi:regulator of RNase E activity RraA
MTDLPDRLATLSADLYSAVLSDCLDSMGLRNQVLSSRLRPIAPGMRLVGYAATIQVVDTYTIPDDPYRGMMQTIDTAREGSVIVIASGSDRCALWGELFTTAARARGVRGTLVDGYVRDTQRIVGQQYPVFAAGARPVDMQGRSLFYTAGEIVEISGVKIAPGDLIFGDADGVVVVPFAVEQEVLGRAMEKVERENRAKTALGNGSSMESVWDEHGVL